MTQAANLAQLANRVNSSGQLDGATGISGTVPSATTATNWTAMPAGTVVLFYQSAAPTGWTQVTTLNDYALRLVSGAGGSTAGTTAFSTVFANQTPTFTGSIGTLAIGATTLSTDQIPSHTHTIPKGGGSNDNATYLTFAGFELVNGNWTSNATGGGGSHTHGFTGTPSGTLGAVTLNVRYANIIICSKN